MKHRERTSEHTERVSAARRQETEPGQWPSAAWALQSAQRASRPHAPEPHASSPCAPYPHVSQLCAPRPCASHPFGFERTGLYQHAVALTDTIQSLAERRQDNASWLFEHLLRNTLALTLALSHDDDRHLSTLERVRKGAEAVSQCVPLLQLCAYHEYMDADVYAWCYDECVSIYSGLVSLEAKELFAPRAQELNGLSCVTDSVKRLFQHLGWGKGN